MFVKLINYSNHQIFTELNSAKAPRRKGLCLQGAMTLSRRLGTNTCSYWKLTVQEFQDNKRTWDLLSVKLWVINAEEFLSRKQLFKQTWSSGHFTEGCFEFSRKGWLKLWVDEGVEVCCGEPGNGNAKISDLRAYFSTKVRVQGCWSEVAYVRRISQWSLSISKKQNVSSYYLGVWD